MLPLKERELLCTINAMTRFLLVRNEDESGVSGTGVVAHGVIFSDGKCALSWLTQYTSVAIYSDLATVKHIHGHNGKTIVMIEDEVFVKIAKTLT